MRAYAIMAMVYMANSTFVLAAESCKTTVECAQAAVTAAAQAQGAVKALEADIATLKAKKYSIACKTVTAMSGRARFPSVVARLSEQDSKDGYTAVSGGCEQVQTNNNFAFISTRPDGPTGWFCQTGDLPGIPADVQVQAYVVGCRITSQ